MTGLWQVEGRSSLGTADRVTLDRRYAEQWSLANDVRLLLRTPQAVLRIEGAH
jgi:lipopolysaccharide/colanic/teichoic acid biosynthesis glycosyltransferase